MKPPVMKCLVLFFGLIAIHVNLFGQNPVLEQHWWEPVSTYGPSSVFVDELHESVYLSGHIPNIGRLSNFGISINKETGAPDFSYDLPDGVVKEVAADGMGGWYIIGDFNHVSDSARNGLAHIGSDGKVTSWNPDINNSIKSLAVNDGILYIAGYFSTVNGLERQSVASFDVASGELTAWNPQIQGVTYAFGFSENKLYIGGTIDNVNDQPRSIASFDLITGELDSWNPGDINGSILVIEVKDGTVYIGGSFSSISGIQRTRLASFDANTGALNSWNPSITVGNSVNELEFKGDTLFIAGRFSVVEGQTRNNLAAISINSNQLFEWTVNTNTQGRIHVMKRSGNTLYVGGEFYTIGGVDRDNLASIHTNSGVVLEWKPEPTGYVYDLEISNNEMYVGGVYNFIGLLPRTRFAALDVNTGAPKDWNPALGPSNGTAKKFAVTEDKIYMAGNFTTVNGQPRNGVAEFDAASGELLDWNPDFDGDINDLLVYGDELYVAGDFISVDGSSRNRLASFNVNTGGLTDWNPVVNGSVKDLVNSGDTLFVAGDFTNIGGQSRSMVAAISANTGVPFNWIANADNDVRTMVIDNSVLYIGGIFSEVNGVEREGLAAINKLTGEVTSWSTESGGNNVSGLAASGNSIYVIGYFTTVNGEDHMRFVELDKFSAAPSDWNPILTGYPDYIVTYQNKLFLTGGLTTEDGGDEFCVYSPLCNYPTVPTFENEEITICPGASATLNIGDGQLNDAINWKWYTGSCGGEAFETGNQIEVTPTETSTYYVRGEGGCTVVSECASITVNVVEDAENPTITAPADLVINTDEGACSASSVSLGNAEADDNCGIDIIVDNAPNSFEIGTTTVTWTATDFSGNTATTTQTVTVVDAELPALTDCPGDLVITSNQPNCAATVDWNQPIAIDNCTATPSMTSNWEAGSVFPFGNTEVIYTVSDDAGNENTCIFNVEVVSDIVANPEYADVSCNGDSDGFIDLNLSGGQGEYLISWNGPNGFNSDEPSIDQLMPGIYTAVIQIDGGCSSTVEVEVSEPDELSITYTANDITSTSDGSITCIGVGGTSPYTYSWTGPNGFTSVQKDIYSLTESGSYFVTITDARGCEFVQEVVLDSTVGIEDANLQRFSIYPNPVSGQLYIEVLSELIGEEVYITNILGEKIYSEVVRELILEVNMEPYASGVYLVHVGSIKQPMKVIKL